MKILAHACMPVLALLLFSAPASQAQDKQQDSKQDKKQDDNMVVLTNPDARAVAVYWTPERFKAARPLPMPQASSRAVQPQELPGLEGQVESGNSRAPSVRTAPPAKRLFTPEGAKPDSRPNHNGEVTSPGAVGTFGAHFTSSRVFPQFTGLATPFSADRPTPTLLPAHCSFRSAACLTAARLR